MKFVGIQLVYYLRDQKVRSNAKTLLKYLLFLFLVVVIYAIAFHYIMLNVEGEHHSWVTGFYWTLTVMSTLGFGDITFESDIGRLFSMLVLLSGIVLLLIVLPFAFIRYFYAPLLESRLMNRAPRRIEDDAEDHIIICSYDSVARTLVKKLDQDELPYFILEPDPAVAANMHGEGLPVVYLNPDNENNFQRLRLEHCRMVVINKNDTENTRLALSIRHTNPRVPIVGLVNEDDNLDVLQLSGANHVLPIKRWLGEQLANRVSSSRSEVYPVGRYNDLIIAEFPVHYTSLAGKTVRQSDLRETSGISVIGIWERGRLLPVHADTELTDSNILVIIGKEEQLSAFTSKVDTEEVIEIPVVVIGGGRVGAAVIESLHKRQIPVNLVERDKELCKRLKGKCNGTYVGDASDFHLLRRAGIMETHSVVLTTNDDSMNIHLSSYCRQLNPELRIVSRITKERNTDIIHRAGADFVLSYASLAAEAVFSIIKGQELVILGERVNILSIPTPKSLFGMSLLESKIGAETGLTVIAIQTDDDITTRLKGSSIIPPESSLLLLGENGQFETFEKRYS